MKAGPEPTPDQLLIDGILASLPTRSERISVGLNFTPMQNAILHEAARERDLSLAAYVRRAALVMAAFDLGLTMEQVRQDEQPARAYGGLTQRPSQDQGPWRIVQVTE